jgi:hypothetical protein
MMAKRFVVDFGGEEEMPGQPELLHGGLGDNFFTAPYTLDTAAAVCINIAEIGVRSWIVKYKLGEDISFGVGIRAEDVAHTHTIYKEIKNIVIKGPTGIFSTNAYSMGIWTGDCTFIEATEFDMEEAARVARHKVTEWKAVAQELFEVHLEQETGYYHVTDVYEHPFFSTRGAFCLDAGEEGKWIFFKTRNDAKEAAIDFAFDQLENNPTSFPERFILNRISDREWQRYVENTASESCGDMPLTEIVEIYADEDAWEAADDRERNRLEERAREQCYESETESMYENGLQFHFQSYGAGWIKIAMESTGFDYDQASEDWVREQGVEEVLATYDGEELELAGTTIVGYRVE